MIESTRKPIGQPQAEPELGGTEYQKPQLLQVGSLRNVLAKGGSSGDHDDGSYYGSTWTSA